MSEERTAERAEPTREQLAEMIEQARNPAEPEEPAEVEEETEVEEEDSTEPVAEEEPEDETEEEAEVEEPEEENDPLAELKARLEAAEAEARHQEAVAGRYTGELGYLRRRTKELEQRLAEVESRGADDEVVERRPQQQRDDKALAYSIKSAMQRAQQVFVSEYPDVLQDNQASPEFRKALDSLDVDVSSILTSDDPEAVERDVRQLLEIAYARYDRDRKRLAIEADKQKRADAASSLKKAKRAAAVTRSPKRASPPPKRFDPKTASRSEIASVIDKLTG